EEEVVTPKQDEDFPMKLARDFLLAVGNSSREKMLKNASPFLADKDRSEEKRIEEKLKALGVDWSEGTTNDPSLQPKAAVELKIVGASGELVNAGSEVKVEAMVKNVGNAPLYRLRGILDSENPAFKGRELPFGKVIPGESRSWTIT